MMFFSKRGFEMTRCSAAPTNANAKEMSSTAGGVKVAAPMVFAHPDPFGLECHHGGRARFVLPAK
jgi:hypothetical protein